MRLWKLPLSSRTVSSVTPCAAVIGNFDGVHRGHKEIITALVSRAQDRGLLATVISFYPHPSVVLGKATTASNLTPLHLKMELLKDLGVDQLALLHFTQAVRELTPQQFIERVLIDDLNLSHLVLGYDTRIGKGRAGDASVIIPALEKLGRSAEIAGRLDDQGEVVSSRRIRSAIEAGDLPLVEKLIGRRYALCGRVIKGDGRGRKIGFPTANLYCREQLLPAPGVYAGITKFAGRDIPSIANVGLRPTFDKADHTLRAEVHLFDANLDLYGKWLSFEVVQKLREEQKFESVQALTEQITRDCELARKLLSKNS